MSSITEDRQQTLNPALAIKVPCVVASAGPLILNGLQTVDGVVLVANDRILVKDQVDQADNGIYLVSTGAWARAQDFDGTYDATRGTLILVNEGSALGRFYRLTTAAPIIFGTSAITFELSTQVPVGLSSFIQIIDTIAALKALANPGATSITYFVRGYYAVNDGGGGMYRWNVADATVDNGGTVIAPNAGAGRWNLIVQSNGISLRQFGSKGDGAADDTAFIQAQINYAKASPGHNKIIVPVGVFQYTALDCDGVVDGLSIIGEVDPLGATSFAHCSTLRCTSAAAGIGISVKSSYGVSIEKIALTYNNAAYAGDLVRTGHSALATDTAGFTMDRCVLTGEGAAVGANSLFLSDLSIIERVHKCTFKNAAAGIRTGTGYTNVLTVEDCTFQILTAFNVKFDGTSTCQAITFKGCTFERLVNGKASAFDMGVAAFIEGLTFIGNWFGDVSVAGGLYWIHAKALGMSVAGNYFGTAGAGAGDYAIQLDGCQGVAIVGGNRFDAKAVNVASACLGVLIAGNDMPVGATAIAVAAGGIPTVFGNNGFSDTHGGIVRIGGVAGPKVLFAPTGGGATKTGALAQSADIVYVSDDGVAARVGFDLTTGKIYPATDAGANQVVAGIFAGNGVPNNANGANGDFYFRGDGTQAGNTVVYHKQAGAWVALITT